MSTAEQTGRELEVVEASPPPPTGPKKMTAERLQRVEKLQATLTEAAIMAERLGEEELGGWVVGTPRKEVSSRAEPLQEMATRVYGYVEALEALYS